LIIKKKDKRGYTHYYTNDTIRWLEFGRWRQLRWCAIP